MTERPSTTPARVILETTIQEIRQVFAFGSVDNDAEKVADLLITLPETLAKASDASTVPKEEMETLQRWAEMAKRSKDNGQADRVPYDILYPWGSRASDKNPLELMMDRIFSSVS